MKIYSIEDIKKEFERQNIVIDNFGRKIDVTPMTIYNLINGKGSKTTEDLSLRTYKAIVEELFGKHKFRNIDDIKKKAKEKKLNARELAKEVGVSHTTIYGLFSKRQKLKNKRVGTYKAIVNFLWKEA